MTHRDALVERIHLIGRQIADLRTGLVYPDSYAEWESTAALIRRLKTQRAEAERELEIADGRPMPVAGAR